jgi:predicted Ser/Thr protein kinase
VAGSDTDRGSSEGPADDPDATAIRADAETAKGNGRAPETDLGISSGTGQADEPPLPPSIGKYLLIGRFPPTGQAEVFRVVHPQLRQERVIKLAKQPVGADGRSVLIEEGRILADLDHPNLVRVYELDFHEDRPYLVMEYIRGRSLKDYAGEHPPTARQAAALVAKVCGAADVAHRHGVVHRDIKHLNILIDDHNEPRLIDFGMARSRTFWSDESVSAGGTFAFMAPEQARVESAEEQQKVGPRSDVFALGAVLYFLLTRKVPFEGRNWRESMARARACEFDRKALDAPGVPRALRRICLKAMAADPCDRYASAKALAESLESYLRRPLLIAASVLSVLIPAAALGAWSRWSSTAQPAGPPVVIHQTQVAPGALAGELIVRVWSKDGRLKRGLKIDEPGALPLLPGEQVHLEARLNQSAHSYLLWVDGQGKASLLYPRQDGKYGSSPTGGSARETVHSPEALDEGLTMKGPGGLETALLVVRRTPLPQGVDLVESIGVLPPSPLRNELEVAVRGFDEGQPSELLKVDLNRGIDDEQTAKLDDPLMQLMERLRSRQQFDLIKAVRFAYRGE